MNHHSKPPAGLESTVKYYQRHIRELINVYGYGTYLLILPGDPPIVADKDRDFSALFRRVHEKGYMPGTYFLPTLPRKRELVHISI